MQNTKNDLDAVREYYDHTRFDYRVSWDDSDSPAVHFGFYDENADNHKDALQNTNLVLANAARVKEGDRVLDAGCGRGGSCFWLANNKKAIVTGITPVKSQIEDCKNKLTELGLEERVNFQQADYCNTPFDDQTFDVVWACESLCHAASKAAFYQEAYRILRPGGRLVIAEYIRSARPLATKDEQLLAAWLNRWAIPDIDSYDEHIDHAKQAGFANTVLENVTSRTRTSLKNLHRNASNWLWFSHILKAVRIRSQVQHDNMVASIRQFEALKKELWYYGLITAQKP